MRHFIYLWMLLGLTACASVTPVATPRLQGVVAQGGPMANAHIYLSDAQGQTRQTRADVQGQYQLPTQGLTPPLMVWAREAGNNSNCLSNSTLRARCMGAILLSLQGGVSVANINPLSDRILSDVAGKLGFAGPQQLLERGSSAKIQPELVANALGFMRQGFHDALRQVGIDSAKFDPVTTPMQANRQGFDAILEIINHNRNYHNPTSESSQAVLTDMSFRPLAGLNPAGPYEALDFARAQRELAEIRSAKTRILIAGDSTAATYEIERMPRMGWGQVFEPLFKAESQIKVLNGGRAGRASRDFWNGGWYAQMARFVKPGDYVLINLGHNDQNCDYSKQERGPADVAGLCSYPNDAKGVRQFPAGRPEMSFQHSLERYIAAARSAGAIPVLLTPTTRYWNAARKEGSPVVANHYTTQNAANGFAFVGNYSQTIIDTAAQNNVPLIDLEAKSIRFANQHLHDWKDYWLAVADVKRYPYYATQTVGIYSNPDTTHFQQKGAEAFAAMIIEGIRETPALANLARQLK